MNYTSPIPAIRTAPHCGQPITRQGLLDNKWMKTTHTTSYWNHLSLLVIRRPNANFDCHLTDDEDGRPEGQSDPGVKNGVAVHHTLQKHQHGDMRQLCVSYPQRVDYNQCQLIRNNLEILSPTAARNRWIGEGKSASIRRGKRSSQLTELGSGMWLHQQASLHFPLFFLFFFFKFQLTDPGSVYPPVAILPLRTVLRCTSDFRSALV